jgi:hypothetical protein
MMASFCGQINREGSGATSMFNLSVNEFKPEPVAQTSAPAFNPDKSANFQPTN